jgi:O-antigen/teichoic acid export membrane protein
VTEKLEPTGAKEESHIHLIQRAAILAGADAAAKACAFVAAVVAARVFGEAGFGALNFAQAIAAYGLVIGGSWLEIYAVKRATQDAQQVGHIASTVIRLRLALGTIVFALLGFVGYLASPLRAVLPLLLLYALSVFTAALSLQWITQAVRATHIMGFATLAAQGTYLLLVLLFTQLTERTWTVPLAMVVGELVAVVALWYWTQNTVGKLARPLPLPQSLAFLRSAAPLGIAQFLRGVALGSDLIIVGALFTLADAGAYAAAYKIYLLGITAISLFMIVSFPKIVRIAAAQPLRLGRQLVHSVMIVLALGSPALIGGTLFAGQVLGWIFGSGFAAGADSMRILLATLVLYAMATHLRNALFAFDKQHVDAILVGITAFVHVVAKIAMGTQLGIAGIALGAFLGEAILLVLLICIYPGVARSAPHAEGFAAPRNR